jgi:transposase-like protein
MFAAALDDLQEALRDGEDIEKAIAEIAEDHGIPPHALRNRAVRAFGPLETYAQRSKALSAKIEADAVRSDERRKHDRQAKFLKEFMSLGSEFLVSPKRLSLDRLKVVKELAGGYGVTPNDFADTQFFFDLLRRCDEFGSIIEAQKEKSRKERDRENFIKELKLLGSDYVVSPSSLPMWRLTLVKEIVDRYGIVPEDFHPFSALYELIKRCQSVD